MLRMKDLALGVEREASSTSVCNYNSRWNKDASVASLLSRIRQSKTLLDHRCNCVGLARLVRCAYPFMWLWRRYLSMRRFWRLQRNHFLGMSVIKTY